MITCLYGQPGTGKSTLATGQALEYLRQGRRVVANFPIDPAPACYSVWGKLADASVGVLPARPSFAQLLSIGIGWANEEERGREDRCGLLVIDEAGPWLDARRWSDKERPQVIDWLLQSRKRGWDIILVAQAPTLIDKQVREAVVEAYARCRRLDRMKVPGTPLRMPRIHIAIARYGLDINAPRLETWAYRGAIEHRCFQSYALFAMESDTGVYSTLPPRLTKFAGQAGHWSVRLCGWWARQRAGATPRPQARPLPAKLPHVAALMRLPPERRLRLASALGV